MNFFKQSFSGLLIGLTILILTVGSISNAASSPSPETSLIPKQISNIDEYTAQDLIDVLYNDDYKTLDNCLAKDLDVNAISPTWYNFSLLKIALLFPSVDCVRTLLDHNALISQEDAQDLIDFLSQEPNPLQSKIQAIKTMSTLLRAKKILSPSVTSVVPKPKKQPPKTSIPRKSGSKSKSGPAKKTNGAPEKKATIIEILQKDDSNELVKRLRNKLNVNATLPSQKNATLLQVAAGCGAAECFRRLLACSANVLLTDDDGLTIAHFLACPMALTAPPEKISNIIDTCGIRMIDLDVQTSSHQATLLHMIVDTLQNMLLGSGSEGWTKHFSAESAHKVVIKNVTYIVQHACSRSLFLVNKNGETPHQFLKAVLVNMQQEESSTNHTDAQKILLTILSHIQSIYFATYKNSYSLEELQQSFPQDAISPYPAATSPSTIQKPAKSKVRAIAVMAVTKQRPKKDQKTPPSKQKCEECPHCGEDIPKGILKKHEKSCSNND